MIKKKKAKNNMRQMLIEEVDLQSITTEIIEEGNLKEKSYKIVGPYIESNTKNKNNRVYPSEVVTPQVESYQKLIADNRAVGELEHPNSLEINPKNISHKTIRLEWVNKNIVEGESRVCSTPNGMIVKALMDEGVKLAVSTRGAGTLKEGIVQKDYKYVCNDIVWDPSAPSAFVEGILEAKSEWVIKNGILFEQDIEDLTGQLKSYKREDRNAVILNVFKEAFEKINKNHK